MSAIIGIGIFAIVVILILVRLAYAGTAKGIWRDIAMAVAGAVMAILASWGVDLPPLPSSPPAEVAAPAEGGGQ